MRCGSAGIGAPGHIQCIWSFFSRCCDRGSGGSATNSADDTDTGYIRLRYAGVMKNILRQTLLVLLIVGFAFPAWGCPNVVEEVRPVPAAAEGELALATFNLWDLMAHGRDGAHVSEAALAERLPVTGRWIVEVLGAPELIAVQEVESLAVLERLASAIVDAGGPSYRAIVRTGNDSSGINSGLLVGEAVEIGKTTLLFADQAHGRHWLYDRPPLRVEVLTPLRFDLLVVHLRSGHGLDDPSRRDWVKRKRQAQADKLRRWMVAERLAGRRPVIVGDLNSAPDAGVFSSPFGTLSQPPWQSVWRWIDEPDRFSYIHRCQRQAIDHILLPPGLVEKVGRAAVTRGNAGRYRPLYGERGTGEVVSDHDALVVFFRLTPDA